MVSSRRAAVLLLAFLLPAAAQRTRDAARKRPSLKEFKDGKAEAADEVKAAEAKQSKMSAVDKVISMLEHLQVQVTAEGEEEARTYNKFACFCKDTTEDKQEAIKQGTDESLQLSATIDGLQSDRNELDRTISELTEKIEESEKEAKHAKEERAKQLAEYEKNNADLTGALEGLEGAIKVLKASKKPSLVQLQAVAAAVQHAGLLADALSLGSAAARTAAASFLQADPEVEMEDYKFQSGGIIKMLEGLDKSFRAEKEEVDAEEVKAVAVHDMKMQELHDRLTRLNKELKGAGKSKAEKQEGIAVASQQLTTVSATLLDDQEYLQELARMCSDRAKTWDQRSKVRQDELSALTAAIGIVKSSVSEKTTAATVRLAQRGITVRLAKRLASNEDAMESIEEEADAADAEAGAPGFLQRLSVHAKGTPDGRQAVMALLRSKGDQLKSAMLTALAARIASDPFAKIKVLIQELIERLLNEEANEANQKGWCDKAIADAEQKRGYAAEAITSLNGEMGQLEARRDRLHQELDTLAEEITELDAKQSEATKMRSEEKQENTHTVKEAQEGLTAVSQAADILAKFYKTAAKGSVDMSLAQGPLDDAPDAGFEGGEAYTGAQGTAGGILGMLDVISSDFERTISETEKAEAQAEKDHLVFMTETGKSLAAKQTAETAKTSQKDEAEAKLSADEEELHAQTEALTTSIKELLELQPACVDTGMSYEERVERRNDEIAALNKALCVLKAYAEFGPDGAGGAC